MNNVFVYDTLMKGFHNDYMLKDSEFIGTGITKKKFFLCAKLLAYAHDLSPDHKNADDISFIHGEAYVCTDQQLDLIDRLQGHPNWFARKKVGVMLESGKSIECWMYFMTEPVSDMMTLIRSGDYKDYINMLERLRHNEIAKKYKNE